MTWSGSLLETLERLFDEPKIQLDSNIAERHFRHVYSYFEETVYGPMIAVQLEPERVPSTVLSSRCQSPPGRKSATANTVIVSPTTEAP